MTWRFVLLSVVLAMVAESVAAVYVLGPLGRELIRDWPIWEEAIPAFLMLTPYIAASVAVVLAGVALVMRRLRIRRARWLSRGPWISAGLLVVGSMLLFGPVGGFHHMFRFGVLGYMILDCDSPPEGLPIPFGRCGARGSTIPLVVTIAVWAFFVLVLNRLLRLRAAHSADFAPEDERGWGE